MKIALFAALVLGIGLIAMPPTLSIAVAPAPTAVAPAAPTAAHVAPPPATMREAWARDLLARLGNTAPTAPTVAFVVAWTIAEDGRDGPGSAFARNNPLNTTQSGYNETESINEDGVRGYATRADGLDATVQTLGYGYYTEIVAGLRANDPDRALRGLIASPWAASHYGGGVGWPQVTIGA